jgi:hypothetical protein
MSVEAPHALGHTGQKPSGHARLLLEGLLEVPLGQNEING